MSVKERKLFKLDQKIVALKAKENSAEPGFAFYCARTLTWIYRLYYEFLKNDVAIRAESLSYFTLFSVMPLMTGIFLFFNLFVEWTPIQKEFDSLLQRLLQAFPDEQRGTLMDFLSQFRDQYLARISGESTAIALFAFLVLIWVAGKVFFNLESLMNRIWAVKRDRTFFSRIQNFFLCMVIFPAAYVLALSLPRLIRMSGQRELGHFLHRGIPMILIFCSLISVFRYFPNTKVKWKSAALGAAVTTFGLVIANYVIGFYFLFGTSTAYGKAGILPIFAYFVYISWSIFILGAEVSALSQSDFDYSLQRLPQTTLAQAAILEKTISILSEKFQTHDEAFSVKEISRKLHVSVSDVEVVFRFLQKKNSIVLIQKHDAHEDGFYLLDHVLSEGDLIELIKDFLDLSSISQNFDVFDLITRLK